MTNPTDLQQALGAEPAVPILTLSATLTGKTPVDELAIVLMQAWGTADPVSNVARNPASYVSTFAEMARAALEHIGAPTEPSVRTVAEPSSSELATAPLSAATAMLALTGTAAVDPDRVAAFDEALARNDADVRQDQLAADIARVTWPETPESYKVWGSMTLDQRNYAGRFGVDALRRQDAVTVDEQAHAQLVEDLLAYAGNSDGHSYVPAELLRVTAGILANPVPGRSDV